MSSSNTLDTAASCKERFKCREVPYRNTEYCVLHFPNADKTADFELAFKRKLREGNFDFRGVWFPAKADFRNFPFPGEVNFKEATFTGEADFSMATFSGLTTFRGVNFQAKVYFRSTIFEKPVTFRRAILNDEAYFDSAIFKQRANLRSVFKAKTDFSQVEFGELTEFSNAVFEKEANFYQARFRSISRFDDAVFQQITNFDEVLFNGRVNFNGASFAQQVYFQGAIFEDRALFDAVKFERKVTFHLASFNDYVRFKGDEVFLPDSPPNFREAKFDHPELVSFHSLHLRPFWFVEVDVTRFALTNVTWDWDLITIDREIEAIEKHYKALASVHAAHSLLGITCWNLAVNAEENHRYDEASRFRYLAMELRRRRPQFGEGSRDTKREGAWSRWMAALKRQRSPQNSQTTLLQKSLSGSVGMLHWLYFAMSGYGERIVRALLVLVGIWAVFAVLYAFVLRDNSGVALGWRGIPYSAAVITLQKPEPHPTEACTQVLVVVETILGPVQAALLALAIRRKFMR